MFTTHRPITTIAVASHFVLSAGSLPATARPDPAPIVGPAIPEYGHCTLARVGTQFVKCDDRTGNGVPVPSFIPRA